jgi:conjugal transfer pilus assembly protein TraU
MWIMAVVMGLAMETLAESCVGRFVNPVTDICWSCMFPMTLGGVRVSADGEDTPNPRGFFCMCPRDIPGTRVKVPTPGIPISFWEPVRLVDVTRTPFCFVNLGGVQLQDRGIRGRGGVENTHGGVGQGRMRGSFYHVHYYIYPVMYWLELLTDFVCMEKGSFDVGYITELDPLWNDDETGFILNPEAVLFGSPEVQAACVGDCLSASSGFSFDTLFWCGGCQGSMYPLNGTTSAHVGGVQASLLMVQRMLAKLHRQGVLWGTVGSEAYCDKYPMPIIKKTQYKTQMTYPIPQTASRDCHPLGRSETLWGSQKEYPYQGEDFGYLIWRKRSCCMG